MTVFWKETSMFSHSTILLTSPAHQQWSPWAFQRFRCWTGFSSSCSLRSSMENIRGTVVWARWVVQRCCPWPIIKVVVRQKLSKAGKAETSPALTLISNKSIFFSIVLTLSCTSKTLMESLCSPEFSLFKQDYSKCLYRKNIWTSMQFKKPWKPWPLLSILPLV